MSVTIQWGDDQVPVIYRTWTRHPNRLPYRKTYRLKHGEKWHDAPTTNDQWEHYVEFEGDIIPAGAVIARELIAEGATIALWTECWGANPVFVSPDLVAVPLGGELADILGKIRIANNNRWGGLPDVVAIFPDGRVVMREAKVKGKDRLQNTQHSFARAARGLLGTRLDLAVIEWGNSPVANPVGAKLRNCLRDPIPEIFQAARYVDDAVSAHLAGDRKRADELIRLADILAIREWSESLWGKDGPWTRPLPVDNPLPYIPKDQRIKMRMPGRATIVALISRDGYHCRFCGLPVARAEIRMTMRQLYPDALPWGTSNLSQHAGFQAIWMQFDHLLPHARGGDNSLENMIITCAPCNNGRSNLTLEEAGLIDPRLREPIRSTWDGLERFVPSPMP